MSTIRSIQKPWLILAAVASLLGCADGDDPDPGPDPALGTVPENLSKGMAALERGLTTRATDDFLEAVNAFNNASEVVRQGGAATPGERDQARFFGGLARIAVLAQPYSDLNADGLGDLGDILDAFGLAPTGGDRATFDDSLLFACTDVWYPSPYGPYYGGQDCELRDLADDSPRSGALQAFLADRVAAGLRDAVVLLENVSDGFTVQIQDGGRVVQIDKTDALFLTAFAQAMLASIDLLGAWNVDVDLDDLQADDAAGTLSLQQFSQDYPLFLKLRDAAKLPQARTDATDAIRSAKAALTRLAAETDPQEDDLIRVVDQICTYTYFYSCQTLYNPAERIADLQADLDEALAVAMAAGPYRFDMGTVADTSDDVVVDPARFFAGVDLRAALPATFTAGAAGDRPGLFVDPTFGGVLVSSPEDLNADADGDGSPDMFGGYSYFFDGYLRGREVSGGYYGSLLAGRFAFAATGNTFVWTSWMWDPITQTYPSAPGTWSRSSNVLTLTFDAALPGSGVQTAEITAERIDDSGFQGVTRYLAADGATVLGQEYQYYSFYY